MQTVRFSRGTWGERKETWARERSKKEGRRGRVGEEGVRRGGGGRER